MSAAGPTSARGNVVHAGRSREPLSKIVADKLRRAILTGRYKPEERLVEDRISEELGVSRVPIREDMNELYFPNDPFQALPTQGYTRLVENMLDHPLIELQLSTEFDRTIETGHAHCFNSMAIDEYFGYDLGPLPYRSIRFHTVTLPAPRLLPVAVVNFTHDLPFTRVTEWKNLPGHGDTPWTTLTYEEPCAAEDNGLERYYPIKDLDGQNRVLYKRYLARVPDGVTFVGRCGQYVYLDMHQAVAAALAVAQRYLVVPQA